jgi:hypothetical protein
LLTSFSRSGAIGDRNASEAKLLLLQRDNAATEMMTAGALSGSAARVIGRTAQVEKRWRARYGSNPGLHDETP